MPDVLSRRTLNRTLLARQHLLARVRSTAFDEIEHLVGMQGQAPLAPYVGLWTRLLDFDAAELAGLMETRKAVRVVGMLRTTIHLLTARDALALAPVIRHVWDRFFGRTHFARDLDGLDLAEVGRVGRELIEAEAMAPSVLGARLAERWPGRAPDSLAMAARTFMPIVQVTPRGVWGKTLRPTMAPLDVWLGQPVGTDADAAPFVLRYLRAFGPASAADITAWSWLSRTGEILERLRPQLREYRDERGRLLYDVAEGVITDAETPAPPRFLPEYDNVLLSHRDRARIIDPPRPLILPPGNGATHGSFLVDGFLAGTWKLGRDAAAPTLLISPDVPIAPAEVEHLHEEGHRLLGFVAPTREPAIEIAPLPG